MTRPAIDLRSIPASELEAEIKRRKDEAKARAFQERKA